MADPIPRHRCIKNDYSYLCKGLYLIEIKLL